MSQHLLRTLLQTSLIFHFTKNIPFFLCQNIVLVLVNLLKHCLHVAISSPFLLTCSLSIDLAELYIGVCFSYQLQSSHHGASIPIHVLLLRKHFDFATTFWVMFCFTMMPDHSCSLLLHNLWFNNTFIPEWIYEKSERHLA